MTVTARPFSIVRLLLAVGAVVVGVLLGSGVAHASLDGAPHAVFSYDGARGNALTRPVDDAGVAEMEQLLTERLLRNGLTGGTDVLRITGAGPNASNLR